MPPGIVRPGEGRCPAGLPRSASSSTSVRFVGTLSGGERQSLAIARAEISGRGSSILDEPTSALGVNEAAIVPCVTSSGRAHPALAIVFITHNVHHAYMIGDQLPVPEAR